MLCVPCRDHDRHLHTYLLRRNYHLDLRARGNVQYIKASARLDFSSLAVAHQEHNDLDLTVRTSDVDVIVKYSTRSGTAAGLPPTPTVTTDCCLRTLQLR